MKFRRQATVAMTMDANQETKVCPLCAENIKAAARICPFCRTGQTRFGRWPQHLGVVISVVPLLVLLCLVCVWLFRDGVPSDGRSFTAHREELVVTRTALERRQKKPEFWLTGYVTNTGSYPWRVQELEVRFLNPDGNLVDVRHAEISERFVVQPHQEQTFRVELGWLAFTNRGILEQVRVGMATDGNRAPSFK